MPYPYNYTKLWEPIQINGMKLRNRISLSPMGTYTPRLEAQTPKRACATMKSAPRAASA